MQSSNWCVSLFISLCFTPNWPLFLPYPAYPSLLIICDFLCPSLPPIALILSCSFTKLCQGRSCYSHGELCFVCGRDAGIRFSPSLLHCLFLSSSSSLFSIRLSCEPVPSVFSVICSNICGFVLKQQKSSVFVLQVVIRSRLDQSMEESQDLKVGIIHIIILLYIYIHV